MDIVYSLGISSLWDEVCHMPVGGVWWLNVDRHADAVSLLNHTLAARDKQARVATIAMGDNPNEIIKLEKIAGLRKSHYLPCRTALKGWKKCTAI